MPEMTTEPVAGGRVQVPWTKEQEDKLRELHEYEEQEQWDIGDTALDAVPMGDNAAHNQAKHFLELLAHRTGFEFSQLRRYRTVSHAWPRGTRDPRASFHAHRAYTSGGPKKAGERARLFERIANDPDTPKDRDGNPVVTVKLVKQHKPVKTKLTTTQTKAERRRGKARKAIDELREINQTHLGPEDRERIQHAIGVLAQIERDEV